MNYSQEVSLVLGGSMLLVLVYVLWRFVRITLMEPPPATPPRSASGPTPLMLKPAFTSMAASLLCLALFQLLEFGAVYWNSLVVYKLGLFVSMWCLFFAVLSLEQLTRRKYASGVVALVIVVVGVWIGLDKMSFQAEEFWVSGRDNAFWGGTWLLLFMYWNVCIFSARNSAATREDERLLRLYGWGLLNLTFVVAMAYSFLAGLHAELEATTWFGNLIGLDEVTADYQILEETPSIWLTFASLQALLLPFLLRAMRADYTDNLPPMPRPRPAFWRFMLVTVAAILTASLYGAYPLMRELAERISEF